MRLASLGYRALRLSGLLALARALRTDGVILCYHNVVPDGDPGSDRGLGLHMPRATFARQLRWLSANYTIVSLEEFVARRGRGASLRGLAALTFDDAYAGVFACAWPLLQDLGIPATVFVVSDAPASQATFWWDHTGLPATAAAAQRGEWLTSLRGDGGAILRAAGCTNGSAHVSPARRVADWATITAAARSGLVIGAHSVTHRALPALDPAELRREVVESRETLTARVGVTPEFFAYPYGLWNDRVRDAVRAAGYAAAFTLDRAARRSDRWSLPRVNIPASIGDAAFEAWTAGLQLRRGA